MRPIDEIDIELLRLLQADGRISNADLAKKIRLSPPATLSRVRQLEESGVIRQYTALVDGERVGVKLTILCQVTLALHRERPIESFIRKIVEIPEVVECFNTSGSYDFFLKIVVRDMKHYEALVHEKISRIPGVGQINSSFVIGRYKQTPVLPL